MSTEFDVQLTAKDLFRFNMRNTYCSLQGPLSIVIAILFGVSTAVCITKGTYQYAALYGICVILFLFYIPVSLHMATKKRFAKNPELSGKMHYVLDEHAITVHIADESAELPWESVFKMIANKNYLFIYSNRINAYIIPREQIADSYDAIKAIAKAQLPNYRLRMK